MCGHLQEKNVWFNCFVAVGEVLCFRSPPPPLVECSRENLWNVAVLWPPEGAVLSLRLCLTFISNLWRETGSSRDVSEANVLKEKLACV